MSRLTLKKMQSESEQMNPMVVENDEDAFDLNFVVEGDFFDGNEFQPVIESEGTQALKMADLEPEEVANDFGEDNNVVAVPANDDDQSVSTFNYAQDSAPAFLKGVPQEVPLKQGREATLGSAVVTLNSQQKPRQAVGSIHSELIYASNRDTEVQANGDQQIALGG